MRLFLFLLLGCLGSCGWNAAGITGCRPLGPGRPLPDDLSEISGVAWSRTDPDLLFSHNDSGHRAVIHVLSPAGLPLGVIPLAGAANLDWEDMAVGECGTQSCIYLADVGDNAEIRESAVIYRTREPREWNGGPLTVEVFPIRLPDGPRDTESLFVLPGEEIFLVSKGRSHPVTLYRYPPPLRPNELVTLEVVQTLSDSRLPLPHRVTGADASPTGEMVVLRTYQTLRFFRVRDGRLIPMDGGEVALRTLHELQGEGVAWGRDGRLALTTEGALGREASLTILECDQLR